MFRILQRKGRARVFGYVLPLTAELKVREWHAYRAYYCGLCKELKREYGFLSRFLLNYDLVLPALLADGVAAVSYTHLDVYKRQVPHSTFSLS